MNERFTRLFSLPENSYTASSPLLIAAGALLRDNQTGRVLAQLKLKNLGDQIVRAVKVRLFPADTAGRSLGEPILFDYLDLNAGRGAEFGAKSPISLPDPTTRDLRVEIVEAVLADRSIWAAPEGAVWSPLPAGQTVEAALGDGELVKELRLRRGADCRFVPARYGELWRCACGEIVRGERCPACGRAFFELDLPALTQARDARVAAERAAAERLAAEAAEKARLEAEKAAEAKEKAEKARARRKKTGKLVGILIPVAILIAAGILLGIPGLSAMQAGKAAQAGDYVTAVEKYWAAEDWGVFAALFHPGEKARALEPAVHYQEGEAALAEGRYLDAIKAFEAAGEYEDAAERMLECLAEENYPTAMRYYRDGNYEKALQSFDGNDRESIRYRQLCQIGIIREQYEQKEWAKLAATARGVDLVPLTEAEVEEYRSILYDAAKNCEDAFDYKTAFALYRWSQKDDYEARMDACNQRYIEQNTGKESYLEISIARNGCSYTDDSQVSISRVDAMRKNGTVSFKVYYRASSEGTCYILSNSEDGQILNTGSFDAGNKTITLEVPETALRDTTYTVIKLQSNISYNYYGYYGYHYYLYSYNTSGIFRLTTPKDLYGNPIP